MNEAVPLPAVVHAICENGKRVAFCSVYVHSRGNLYLQYIGFAKDAEPGKKYGYYVETLKALHALGYPFIMGAISNKNKRALMWALRAGFEIHGCRQDTGGELFIEVLRTDVPDSVLY
ncbi:MAG: hypothetical protein PHG91_09945 [Syntrophales bacterium]|nr:hypothetical protein [Syntrophales bacterium]MDD5233703.1 hypothetical protein [Syntrophales bacterium]MDD5531795.1 hypothetical protein [Syntrophales bacterium]